MYDLSFVVQGVLSEWLEKIGRHDLVDAKEVSVDNLEFNRLLEECKHSHPQYDDETASAWAIVSIIDRKHISLPERQSLGIEPATAIQRVAQNVESQGRDFRGLRTAFDKQYEQVESAKQAIATGVALQTEAISSAVAEQGKLFARSADQIVASVNSFRVAWMESEHRKTQEGQARGKWQVAWRIAVLLALLMVLCVVAVKAAPDPPQPNQLRAIEDSVLHGPLFVPQGSGGNAIARMQWYNGSAWVNAATGTPLPFTCVSGCTAGGAFTDNSAFTVGTSSVSNIGALYDSGADPSISNGNAGRVRMDAHSYLYTDCVVGCSGGSTTPSDAFANPTTAGLQFDLLAGFNGTTWDRLRVDGSKNLLVNVANSSLAVTGTFWQATQPVSGTFWQTTQPVSGTFWQATQPISIASAQVASGAFASGAISDGADVTLGSKADAKNAATDTTAITAMQVLKEISSLEQAPASRAVTNAGTFPVQAAVTAASGAVASGAIASGAIASGAVASGAISSGACVSGCIADGGLVTLGAKADAKSTATDTTAITAMQVLKEISFMLQTPAALPANQSVNLAQVNGHTSTECGVNGCQSVGGNIPDGSALSSNNDPIVMAGKGSGNARVPVVCDSWAPFSLASTTALKIITLASSKNTYICSINILSAAANNVALIDGTNSTTDCNAATHGLAGGTTAATGWNFAANGGLTQGTGIGVIAATVTVSHDVCLLASGSGQVSGVISYTQF